MKGLEPSLEKAILRYEKELKSLFKNISINYESLLKLSRSDWFRRSTWNFSTSLVKNISESNKKFFKSLFLNSPKEGVAREVLSKKGTDLEAQSIENRLIAQSNKYAMGIPLEIDRAITKYCVEVYSKNGKSADLEKKIQKLIPHLAKTRVQLIARTQASKIETEFTRARSESLGLKWYIWKSQKDIRTRDSHKELDGVLINWLEPPDPEKIIGRNSAGTYHAGCTFNCRCKAVPVVDINTLFFPVKVYIDGKIKFIGRKKLSLLNIWE